MGTGQALVNACNCTHNALMREYVNIRLDKDIYDGLGHLAVALEALPEYQGLKLSNARVARMALVRGIVALEEEARTKAMAAAAKPGAGTKATVATKRGKGGK